MPTYALGDNQNWTLQFNNGQNLWAPGNVLVSIGYIKGLIDGTYGSAFAWLDRLNNRHVGSIVLSGGIPTPLTWDEAPIGVFGDNGAWLVKGRKTSGGVLGQGGTIRKVYVKYGGAGLSAAPAIRFQGGANVTGRGAKIGAIGLTTGAISSIAVADGGYGYTLSNAPEIIITDSAGSGARAYVDTLLDGVITHIAIQAGGSSYSSPSAAFRDAEASATATVGGSSGVTGAVVTNPGMGYTTPPTIAFGSGAATATAALLMASWGLSGLTITNAGLGYLTPPAVSFSGGSGSGAKATTVIATPGTVVSIAFVSPTFSDGNLYVGIGAPPAGGVQAQAHVSQSYPYASPPIPSAIIIDNPGSGYLSAPAVTITDPTNDAGPQSGLATATLGDGHITSLVLTSPGSGYGSTTATVAIAAAPVGGTNATATAQLVGSPISSVITITAASSGYTAPPAMSFSGGNGNGAAASALVSLGVTAITMVEGGYAYTALPDVHPFPDNGALLIPSGVLAHSTPYLEDFNPISALGAITSTPFTAGDQDQNGNLLYEDSLIIIRPRYVLQPTFTLGPDGLTYSAVFAPVNAFVTALLAYQSAVVLDFEIFGSGRLLLKTKLKLIAS